MATQTQTMVLTRSVGGTTNACLHAVDCSEHGEAIALAVAHGEINTQLIDAAGLQQLAAGGTWVDRASCAQQEE